MPNDNNKAFIPTADSTHYYAEKAYKAMLKYGLTSTGYPEMKKLEAEKDQALKDKARQANKGKKGYDANGYPLKTN